MYVKILRIPRRGFLRSAHRVWKACIFLVGDMGARVCEPVTLGGFWTQLKMQRM